MNTIEYYADDSDTGKFFVCFDRYYIFEINPNDDKPIWKLLETDGEHWDAVHQRIYRNFRVDRISKEDLPRALPPVPDAVPEIQKMVKTKSEQSTPVVFDTNRFPLVAYQLRRTDNPIAHGFIVLYEDTYESLLGDGEFHYPQAFFFTQADAKTYIAEQTGKSMKYHLRYVTIELKGNGLCCPEIQRKMFDHVSAEEVLRLAEVQLTNPFSPVFNNPLRQPL